jgi:hypothetical protein
LRPDDAELSLQFKRQIASESIYTLNYVGQDLPAAEQIAMRLEFQKFALLCKSKIRSVCLKF